MSKPTPADGFSPTLYGELRRLAASKLSGEPPGHTLDATALVHEAYIKLGGAEFQDGGGFYRAAAVAMQRVLVDHARRKRARKRGGAGTVALRDGETLRCLEPDLLLDVDDALSRLAAEDPSSADVARLRLFAGLSIEDAAEALGVSRATAFREWAYARSWLATALDPTP